jgi:hypothetical protein
MMSPVAILLEALGQKPHMLQIAPGLLGIFGPCV